MGAPVIVNISKSISSYLPIKIDNVVRCDKTKGIKINKSVMVADLIVDRFSKNKVINIDVSVTLEFDVSGLASALPDGKYSTLFFLDFEGLCKEGSYVFFNNINANIFGSYTGTAYGESSNNMFLQIYTNSSNAKGTAIINMNYMTENVDFGYGILFPDK